jgi:hypothetical protein
METLPYGVTDDSIEVLRACEGTPGFMMISFIIAISLIFVGFKYYKK